MSIQIWIVLYMFIFGCLTMEIGLFLRKLDDNINEKLTNPQVFNTSQLLKDLTGYSYNIKRLLKLFKLRRERIMADAKVLYSMKHPAFIRNFSCENTRTDFLMTDRQYKDLLHFIETITISLSEFYKACKENPGFIGIQTPKPEFSLDRLSSVLESFFKNPEFGISKYKVFKSVENYYQNLGQFTKKFVMGRESVMTRAKEMFESGSPKFLKHYDYLKIQKAYSLTISEAASLDSNIRKIRARYDQFINACFKNPNFKSKVDFTSIRIVKICDATLKDILLNPSPKFKHLFFKQLKRFYHTLGYLRRQDIPHQMELLQALNHIFGTSCPEVLKPHNLQKIKCDLGMEESSAANLEEYIGHLSRRFYQVQRLYLKHPNDSYSVIE